MYNSLNIAERIKLYAKEKNVVLKTMLSDLSLGSNTMSNLRHGRMIAADALARIADYLDCSTDYLLNRTDTPKKIIENSIEILDDEKELLEAFNNLSEKNKGMVLGFIYGLTEKEKSVNRKGA